MNSFKRANFSVAECRGYLEYIFGMHAPYGITEIVAIAPGGGGIAVGYFKGVGKAMGAIRQLAGKKNLFCGLNPRKEALYADAPDEFRRLGSRSTKKDIAAVTMILVDIDVVTPGRKQAATKAGGSGNQAPCTREEHNQALATAGQIRALEFPHAPLVATNGAQVHVPVLFEGSTDELVTIEQKVKTLYRELVERHAGLLGPWPEGKGKLELDRCVADIGRLAALPGTLKMKGKATRTRPYRMVTLVEPGVPDDYSEFTARIAALEPSVLGRKKRKGTKIALSGTGLRTLDALCAGWNEILTDCMEHPSGGRSVVLKGLCWALAEAGVDDDDIVDVVLLHDKALGQKLAARYDPEAYIRRELEDVERPFSCDWVVEAIGVADHCLGCPKYRSRRGKPRAFPISHGAHAADDVTDLGAARELVVEAITSMVPKS